MVHAASAVLALLCTAQFVVGAKRAKRADFKLTCEGNLAINPPPGGSLEVGKMLFGTDGSINVKPEEVGVAGGGQLTLKAAAVEIPAGKLLITAAPGEGGEEASTTMVDVAAQLKMLGTSMQAMAETVQGLTDGNVALRETVQTLVNDKAEMKKEMKTLKEELAGVKSGGGGDVAELNERVTALEALTTSSTTTTTTTATTTTATSSTGTTTTNTAVFCTSAQDALDNGKATGCAFPTTFTADLELEEWMIPALRWVEKIEGNLRINAQHYLTSLSSILPNLEEVTDYVSIDTCNGLVKDVAGFASLVKVGGEVRVNNNKNMEVLDNRLFPNLAFAGGEVSVQSNANPELTNMSNYLPSLETSTGRVNIYNNPKLATMANVCESLVTAGGVAIGENHGLTALDSTTGFGNLATSTGAIYIQNNNELLSINGVFPALTAVAAGISISSNPKLHTVGPVRFGASSSPMTMAGTSNVYSNTVLANVAGLQGLVCTATGKCSMNWWQNDKLDQTDVCGVWDSMSPNVKKHPNTCETGGKFPCYGPRNPNFGAAANC
eukprot:gene8736-17555_t